MKKIQLLLAFLISLFFINSCSKHENLKENKSAEILSGSGGGGGGEDSCDPANTNDGWDSAGIYHNLAMDYVLEEASGQPKNISDYVGYANDYLTNTFSHRVSNLSSKLFSTSSIETLLSDTTSFIRI